jgi:hypothetical protein
MDPVRASIGGGVAATAVLTVFLLGIDVLVGRPGLFVFTTFTSLCAIGGPPYCDLGSIASVLLTFVTFVALFAVAWPLLYGGFTWALPGESGLVHGTVFGLILWLGYAVGILVALDAGGIVGADLLMLQSTLLGYLGYGLVLGGTYDRLAGHRTFMSGVRR